MKVIVGENLKVLGNFENIGEIWGKFCKNRMGKQGNEACSVGEIAILAWQHCICLCYLNKRSHRGESRKFALPWGENTVMSNLQSCYRV